VLGGGFDRDPSWSFRSLWVILRGGLSTPLGWVVKVPESGVKFFYSSERAPQPSLERPRIIRKKKKGKKAAHR